MIFPRVHWFFVLLCLTACGGGGGGGGDSAPTPVIQTATPAVADTVDIEEQLATLDGLSFNAFTNQSFELILQRAPEGALIAGIDNPPVELNDLSEGYAADTTLLLEGVLQRLQSYSPSAEEQTLFGIYETYLEDRIAGSAFRDFEFPGSFFLTGVPSQTELLFTEIHPLINASDVDDYITRLSLIPGKFVQMNSAIINAESNGIVMPRSLLDVSINRHRQIANATAEGTPYYTRLANDIQATGLSGADQQSRLADAANVIGAEVIPAYQNLVNTLEAQQTLAPQAIGVGQYVGGSDYYNYALAHHTTSTMSADEIHTLGLSELERIHAEMREVFSSLGYPAENSISANLSQAASDGGFVSANNVVSTYETILDEAATQLPSAFSIFPQAELIVVGGQSGGFYIRPAPDGSRPGAFHASNTSSQPRYLMKSLAYHEGVPGHHMQIAIAQEQGQSLIQQTVTFTGFVEGWALYAERLALELGWYDDDPYGNLGRLQYEALRAARMVVDTGIHSRGWSFTQASNFFRDNTGFSSGFSDNQIGRYAIWPGQSTAYMVGMLEILDFRGEVQSDPDFDLTEFHDQLLTRGAVPLTMLRDEF